MTYAGLFWRYFGIGWRDWPALPMAEVRWLVGQADRMAREEEKAARG
jgi:hypothetical protein